MALGATAIAAAQQVPDGPSCQASASLVRLAELNEASGIAVSSRSPGRLWTHNDSGKAVLTMLDARGSVTGRIQLTGITIDDWEAIAVGTCPGGSCVYIADIGDNDAKRKQITVYRVAEPVAGEDAVGVKDVFHATYPDGPHDAETLLVTPEGRLFIVTKGDTGPVALYRFPTELRSNASHQLERVGNPRGKGRPAQNERVTDGAVSPDGRWVVLRSVQSLAFHHASDFFAGKWGDAGRIDLKGIGESQGEGVAISANGTVFLTGEGGGKSRPGTFAALTCSVTSSDEH